MTLNENCFLQWPSIRSFRLCHLVRHCFIRDMTKMRLPLPPYTASAMRRLTHGGKEKKTNRQNGGRCRRGISPLSASLSPDPQQASPSRIISEEPRCRGGAAARLVQRARLGLVRCGQLGVAFPSRSRPRLVRRSRRMPRARGRHVRARTGR